MATGLVDDVLVGNCFASQDELEQMASVDMTRTDASDYLLRSLVPRTYYQQRSIPARPVPGGLLRRGDVMVVNDNLAHYLGEVQVALRDIPDDGTRNLVGRIPAHELFLLDYVLPEHFFGFIR